MDEVEQKIPAVQERGKVVLVTVSSCYLCSVDSALNSQGPHHKQSLAYIEYWMQVAKELASNSCHRLMANGMVVILVLAW